jgi:hypothetical protein
LKQYEADLAGLTEHANALRHAVIEEEDWALVANQLRSIEVDLGSKRREIEADATDVAQASRDAEPFGTKLVYESDRGKLVEQIKRTYSFNSSAILARVMEISSMTFGETIGALQGYNALSLTWKISFLENVADRYGFELRRAHHEIEDGDPDYLVGVVSKSAMKRG